MFLKVPLHTISSCLDLLTKTMKQLPQQIKQNITDVSESTVTQYIQLFRSFDQNYEIVTTTNKTENITDVSESLSQSCVLRSQIVYQLTSMYYDLKIFVSIKNKGKNV